MTRMPTLFISHGAPTYALAPGVAGAQLAAIGASIPRPKAVLVVSPHWTTREVQVGVSHLPQTIHDFGGFDPALYEIRYPAAGHPETAVRVCELLRAAGWNATPEARRGLDHGAWVPMRHLYPAADVPVFQVSMPARLDAQSAYEMGRALSVLQDEGVLVIGSGSLTHNLYEFRSANDSEPAYASEFVRWVRDAVTAGDHDRLLNTLDSAPHSRRAHPTAEHLLPLFVAAGAAGPQSPVDVLDGGFTHGVLSMESYVFGAARAAVQNSQLETTHA
jgi:4,5-DOPA dioxygenase extradiol